MDDILVSCARNFDELSKYNYNIILGTSKRISVEIDMRFLKENFTHIVGLDHLTDISDFNTHSSSQKRYAFERIKSGKIGLENISKSSFFTIPLKQSNSAIGSSYYITDRLNTLQDISSILATSIKGQFLPWNKSKCNIRLPDGSYRKSNIEANYLLAIPSPYNSNEKVFFFMHLLPNKKINDKTIRLSVFSAFADNIDLTIGQDKPFTILQVSRTHSQTGNSELLGVHPAYQKQENEISQSTSQKASFSKPTEFHTHIEDTLSVKKIAQGNGTIALAPQAPQSDFFTRIANALVNGPDSIVHKASMAFEKLNVTATKALNSLFAPEQPKKPHRASQSQRKGKSPTKAKTAEIARHAAPAKQSEQKQEKRSSVLADLKTIRTEQAQDKPERSHQRSRSNNQEL